MQRLSRGVLNLNNTSLCSYVVFWMQRTDRFWNLFRTFGNKRAHIFLSFFILVEGGRVYLRDWRDRESSGAANQRKPIAPGALKTRLCWFYTHHPQGCPLMSQTCAFAHGPDELRPSTRPLKKKMF